MAHGAVVSAGGFDGVAVFAGVEDVGDFVKGDIVWTTRMDQYAHSIIKYHVELYYYPSRQPHHGPYILLL